MSEKGGMFRGEVPFDDSSVLKIYDEAGIGLALHNESHNLESISSMRPFEIVASEMNLWL